MHFYYFSFVRFAQSAISAENYHFFKQRSNTGLEMEFLQKYLLIPLDIFKKKQQNKGISSKKDAWLSLCLRKAALAAERRII